MVQKNDFLFSREEIHVRHFLWKTVELNYTEIIAQQLNSKYYKYNDDAD
jgi:hypothetical protein